MKGQRQLSLSPLHDICTDVYDAKLAELSPSKVSQKEMKTRGNKKMKNEVLIFHFCNFLNSNLNDTFLFKIFLHRTIG